MRVRSGTKDLRRAAADPGKERWVNAGTSCRTGPATAANQDYLNRKEGLSNQLEKDKYESITEIRKIIMETLEPEHIEQAQVFINNAEPGYHVIEDIFGDSWFDIVNSEYPYAKKFRTTVICRLFENIKCLPRVYGKPLAYELHPD